MNPDWRDLKRDLVNVLLLALMMLVMCYVLRGTDWEREQNVFTETNERTQEIAD